MNIGERSAAKWRVGKSLNSALPLRAAQHHGVASLDVTVTQNCSHIRAEMHCADEVELGGVLTFMAILIIPKRNGDCDEG